MPKPDRDPLVTVYITSHNYGRFIRQAIESVLNQTFQDFELIIIDDGSTDDSREIIEGYAGNEKIIPVFQHNKGLNVTNNIALRMARGRYIMRLDADDWLDQHALEVMSGALERDPKVGLVFPDYYHVDADGKVIEAVRRHDFDDVTLLDQPAHGACTMIRRQCLLDIDGYDESFRCQDGYDLWIRFIEHFEVRNVNLPLFFYRQHGSSLTRNEERILDTRNQILKRRAQTRELSVVAIVPVRGAATDPGSTALRPLGGRPLIDWTLAAAVQAERVRAVIVSTPDQEILDHVGRHWKEKVLGVERDPRLARPNTYLAETLRHALGVWEAREGTEVRAVLQLSVESPFRTARQIDAAIDVMALFETDAVIGVRPEVDVFFRHDGSGLVPVRKTVGLRLEEEEVFRDAGQIRLMSRKVLMAGRAELKGNIGHVVVDQRAALALRSQFDWKTAEAILAAETREGT